jgi:hypothetical protein
LERYFCKDEKSVQNWEGGQVKGYGLEAKLCEEERYAGKER